jgi:hypothetical protein
LLQAQGSSESQAESDGTKLIVLTATKEMVNIINMLMHLA